MVRGERRRGQGRDRVRGLATSSGLKFFFDEDISHPLVRALALFEGGDKPDFEGKCDIKHVFDMYPKERRPVKDTTFIPEMTELGYIIVTVDHAQKKTKGKHAAESQAYVDSGAIAFWLPKKFVNPGKKSDEPGAAYKFRQASMLFEWWPAIKWQAGTAEAGHLFDVDDRGKVHRRS